MEGNADYGACLVKNLPRRLSGFGKSQLKVCRQFYRVYPIANALRTQLFPNGVEYKTLWRWRRMYFGGQELSGNRQQGEEECGRTRIGTDRHFFMERSHCFSGSRIAVFRAFRGSKDIFLENSPFTCAHVAGTKKTRLFLSGEARFECQLLLSRCATAGRPELPRRSCCRR